VTGEPRELDLGRAIVSFDGRVIELFDPTIAGQATRFHVALVESIGVVDGKLGPYLEVRSKAGAGGSIFIEPGKVAEAQGFCAEVSQALR
jgi:hypothetical protein